MRRECLLNVKITQSVLKLRDRPPKTKEELDYYLRYFYNIFLAKIPIEDGNSSPLDFVWDVYSTAMGFKINPTYNFLGMAARGSQKSLCCAAVEALLLQHDKWRDFFHMASIRDQSYVTYDYFKAIISRAIMKGLFSDSTMKETKSIHGRQLKIGTATMDSVNSFHGCIAETERVNTESGFIKLGDLFKMNRKPNRIESSDGLRKVVAYKQSGKQRCKTLVTKRGYELTLTHNHHLWIFDGELKFKRVDELKTTDYVLIRHSSRWPKCLISKNRFKYLMPRKDVLSDFYYLVGRAIGDGCLTVDRTITYTTKNYDDAVFLRDCFKNVYPDSNPRIVLGKSCCSVTICNKKIKDQWVKLGINPVKSFDKIIPEFIFSSTKSLFYDFLSGYWDADGTSRNRFGDFGQQVDVSFGSTSKKLLLDIQLMLARDGLNLQLYLTKRVVPNRFGNRDAYNLCANGSIAIKLANNLRSRLRTIKSSKLRDISLLKIDGFFKSKHWPVDLVRPLMSDIMTNYHSLVKSGFIPAKYSGYNIGGRSKYYTDEIISRFLAETVYCSNNPKWKILANLLVLPVWIERVSEIKDSDVFETFDVQMDGEPIWAPNLFLAHNSVIQDEVDLTSTKIFDESKGMLSAQHGRMPLNVCISSRKFAVGNIQNLLDKSTKDPEFPLVVHRWGILENTQKCFPDRHGEYGTTIYVDEDNLIAISESEYENDPTIKKTNFTPMTGYKNCLSCGIFSFCQGRLPNQTDDNPHLQPIETTKGHFKTDSVDFFKSQRLNKKPSKIGLIYPMWAEETHVKSYAEMWEIFHGIPHPDLLINPETGEQTRKEIDQSELIATFIENGCRCVVGVDFGFSILGVAGLYFIDGSGRIYFIDEIGVTGFTDREFAEEIKKKWGKLPVDMVYADPESPGGKKEIRIATGWVTTEDVDKAVDDGIETMRRKMRIPGTRESQIFASYNCSIFREEVKSYRTKIDPQSKDPIPQVHKKNDHSLDQCRYVVHSIFGSTEWNLNFSRVSTVQPKTQFNAQNPLRAPTAVELASKIGQTFVDNRDDYEKTDDGQLKKKDSGPNNGGGFSFSF